MHMKITVILLRHISDLIFFFTGLSHEDEQSMCKTFFHFLNCPYVIEK